MFFVLSGFLITTLAVREEGRRGHLDTASFYIRRVCRIFPLYTFVLLFYCLLILVVGFQPERRSAFVDQLPYYGLGFPEHGFFLDGAHAPFDGSWSLGVEEKFYLLWPLVFVAAVLTGTRARMLLLALVGAFSIAAPAIWRDGVVVAPYVQLAFGCAAALLLQRHLTYERVRRLGATPVLIALCLVFVALQFALPAHDTAPRGVLYAPYGLVVALLLIGLVTTTDTWIGWLWSRPLVLTATLSYALYLIHNFGLNLAEKIVPAGHGLAGSLVSTALGIGMAYVFAYYLHRTIEQPFIGLGRRITRRRSRMRAETGFEEPVAQLP